MPPLVERCNADAVEDWHSLRCELWPDASGEEHRREIAGILGRPDGYAAFLLREDGAAIGFAEVALRRDYVCGCESTPVPFLEGIYVTPGHRRRGGARLLCGAVERWAAALGHTELASAAELENTVSHELHKAVGFSETERAVFFHKRIGTQ